VYIFVLNDDVLFETFKQAYRSIYMRIFHNEGCLLRNRPMLMKHVEKQNDICGYLITQKADFKAAEVSQYELMVSAQSVL
jgi:hypothetical protein